MHVVRGGVGGGTLAAAVALAGVLGCTPRERSDLAAREEPAPTCPPARTEVELPVITTLVTRDHEVTVHASDEGLRFSVAQADGAPLVRWLTAAEFEHGFPALHRRFEATFAGDEPWLDASLRAPQPTEHGAAAMKSLVGPPDSRWSSR